MSSKNTNKSTVVDEAVVENTTTVTSPQAIVGISALQAAKQTADQELRAATLNKKKLGAYYQREKKVSVTVSPFYAPRLGRVATITVNAISVYVPCDGKAYEIPETFAASLRRKLANIDALEARGKALSDVANNVESFAGQLRI